MSRVSYQWWAEGLSGGIRETSEEPDGREVFATFTEAREALGNWFSRMSYHYGTARKFAREIRKADLRDGRVAVGVRPPQKY